MTRRELVRLRVWAIEVSPRAALHAERRPRDMRWWYGYAEKAGWLL